MKPLSHHEILGWIEPFARRGLQADLAQSDRLAGKLLFRDQPLRGAAPGESDLVVRLRLERPAAGRFRLLREARLASGLVATLALEGEDAAQLLEQLERVPVRRQLLEAPGYVVVFDHELEPGAGEPGARLRLVQATAQLDGFRLHLDASVTARGAPGRVELTATPQRAVEIPEDLLAVLGFSWTRLTPFGDAWRGELRLRGAELARGQLAETRLLEAVRHLATTFAEPPARFHERQVGARWRVTMRRAVPLLVCVALIVVSASVRKLGFNDDALLRMIIFNVPPLLMIAVFCLPELPRIEFPPLPRRLTARSWNGD